MAVVDNNPQPKYSPAANAPARFPARLLCPDLASSLQIAVFEEEHGHSYLLRQTGNDKNRTIKTDLPHPAGYWEIEVREVVGECLYFGMFAVPVGTRPTLDVWQRACSSWIADDTVMPPSHIIHGKLVPSKFGNRTSGACTNPVDPKELFMVYQRYPTPCPDANEYRRPLIPDGINISPMKVGNTVGFHWIPEEGLIWLYVNGIRLGLFMSGLRGYEVYPAVSFQLVDSAVCITFNKPLPQIEGGFANFNVEEKEEKEEQEEQEEQKEQKENEEKNQYAEVSVQPQEDH